MFMRYIWQKIAHKDACVLIPVNWGCVTLYSNRDFADVIKAKYLDTKKLS